MKNLVVFSGAGISAESGIRTFRDSGGLWEEFKISEVATPEGWGNNPAQVLEFYNARRKQIAEAKPNDGHRALVELEKSYNVQVITQNIDDLHERAGSSNVLHLHGEIFKSRSTGDERLVYPVRDKIRLGDKCEKGFQLRPHIVWFGEMVPNMEKACLIASKADIFIVVGTSLNVYPAASLIHYVKDDAIKILVDPNPMIPENIPNLDVISEGAGTGLKKVCSRLIQTVS